LAIVSLLLPKRAETALISVLASRCCTVDDRSNDAELSPSCISIITLCIRLVPPVLLLSHPVQGPGDEPVWRQLLRLYLDDIYDPDVVQQVVAALEQQ
jgi:hypothetical protein